MKRFYFIILISFICTITNSQFNFPAKHSFMQANNINSVFTNQGYYNYDKWTYPVGAAGFIWPVTSVNRLTTDFTTGIYIGGKIGPQRELRLAASYYNSHYTGGNIPVIGQVPPLSVCNDSTWTVYLVNLNDPSLVNGGTRSKTAGGRNYTFNYTSWSNWPVSKGAPYVEVNNIPGYQPGWNSDRPGIGNGSHARPEEICFTVYMDYTKCTNDIHTSEMSLPGGTLPLGVEFQQIVFAFNCPTLSNMYFIKYRIINKSSLNWDSVFVSIVNDIDLGWALDDAGGCDSARNLSFIYNNDNDDEGNYGVNPPACGSRLLQSPVKFTGLNSDTAKLPYDTLIGYKLLGMSGSIRFMNTNDPCIGEPDNAVSAYYLMRGLDGCGNPFRNWVTGAYTSYLYSGDACHRTGWYDSISGNKSYKQNSGPFHMNSGDTQILVISQMVTREGGNNFQNVCSLQSLSDSALKYYYNDFRSCTPIGINPISTEVPDRFMLYQNYPNPFNPSTKIRFSIPPAGNGNDRSVKVIIYDVLGREISTLVNEELSPGIYEIEWDAENYASGIYYYKLTAENYSDFKKMVVVK
jgi:type IX secretion system substrate protein